MSGKRPFDSHIMYIWKLTFPEIALPVAILENVYFSISLAGINIHAQKFSNGWKHLIINSR